MIGINGGRIFEKTDQLLDSRLIGGMLMSLFRSIELLLIFSRMLSGICRKGRRLIRKMIRLRGRMMRRRRRLILIGSLKVLLDEIKMI